MEFSSPCGWWSMCVISIPKKNPQKSHFPRSTGEILGYICRILSSKQSPNYTITLFVLQSVPTLIAPVLFAASIYMCLGRIIRISGGEHLSLIPPSYLTTLFVVGDVLGLIVQGAGAIVMPLGTLSDYYTGAHIVIGGLALLVTSFALFMFVCIVFDLRIRRAPTARSVQTSSSWSVDLRIMYITSALIFVRSVFRLVEYSQGNKGWLIRREWTLYVFDAALMWIVLVVFNFWHPSHVEAVLNGGKYCERGLKIVELSKEEVQEASV
jgi:hypothetical protein